MVKISVIIPVYNAERYLSQTLDSILGQSFREIEVICVDDGSTDSSLEILQSYHQKDPRVQVLRQQNLHAGIARNAGLAAATGEYVHFMDADDYVLDYAYEAIYNKAVKYDLDCLKFASVPYDMDRDQAVLLPAYTLGRLRPGDFNRLLSLEENTAIFKVNVAPWNGIYRRSFLEEHQLRFNDLFCVNDRSFFAAVITNARRIMVSRDRLVVHRVNMSDSLVGVRAQHFDCHFKSIQIVQDRMIADGIPEEIQGAVMRREFTDLMVWFEKYQADPKLGEEIRQATRQFVKQFESPFSADLEQLYQERLERITASAVEETEPEPLPLYVPACSNPKVSVVVPIYNVEDYLNEALHSLTNQTLEEMEFLCVNDGSTDGSLTILKEYANLDKRFKILDGPNGGYGKAMNRGIDAATGEYIGILEPDDFVPEHMFKSLYRAAARQDLDLVKADFYRFTVNDDGSLKKNRVRMVPDVSYYNRVLNPQTDKMVFSFVINTWAGIYSRKFLNKWNIRHNETPGASYQDNGFWFKTFCRATRVMFLDKVYYYYRRDNPNASMVSTSKLYCATEEFRLIQEWMNQDPHLVKEFTQAFYRKKFHSYLVTYRRIAPEFHKEYLRHIYDEFHGPMEAGLLNEELFGVRNWTMLQDMLADPEGYSEKIQVSVIIPVYNGAQHIRECLDPLLVFHDVIIEIICVDDGSTDNTLEILREYEAKDPRIKVLTQENAGAGAARNNGMKIARGQYLSFLDADDFFEPDMLRRAYEWSRAMDTDITVFRCDLYQSATRTFHPANYTIKQELLPETRPFAGLDIEQDLFRAFVGWAWDKLFRADFVRAHGLKFQEQRTTNDMLFVFSAIVQAKRIYTMDSILAHHRREAGSLSVTREQSWDNFYNALIALRQQLRDWKLYDRLEQDFINYSLHFTLWNLDSIRGESYFKLYDRLLSGWFEELGLLDRPADYFYSQEDYDTLCRLRNSSAYDHLFDLLDQARAQAAQLESANASLTRRNRSLRNKNLRLEKRLAASTAQISSLKGKNKAIKKSFIWKTGRLVTWLPRKAKQLLGGK